MVQITWKFALNILFLMIFMKIEKINKLIKTGNNFLLHAKETIRYIFFNFITRYFILFFKFILMN